MIRCEHGPREGKPRGGQGMVKADEVEAMLGLHALGWGTRRIAEEFGCSRNTVRRYLEAGGWTSYSRAPGAGMLSGREAWLEERFFRHRGNAEVVRQDLKRELSIDASLRTVERAVVPYRRLLAAEAKATMRFETPPGRQLQIDFGERRVPVAGGTLRAHLFVATLGYSRRTYVKVFAHQRQSSWFAGLEGAFLHFGGVTDEVLVDNPKQLVVRHSPGADDRRRELPAAREAPCHAPTPARVLPVNDTTRRGVSFQCRHRVSFSMSLDSRTAAPLLGVSRADCVRGSNGSRIEGFPYSIRPKNWN